ncbi:MAG: crossover junction endodeoxyribonuclease RuvC [bacterium]
MHNQVIIGIDPGSRITGYGIVRVEGGRFLSLSYGSIDTSTLGSKSEILEIIFKSISEKIESFKPDILSLERIFYYKNIKSAFILGEVRGVILLLAGLYRLELMEFTSTEVKNSLIGYGRAKKSQISFIVKRLLNLTGDLELDITDALALSLCAGLRVMGEKCLPILKG